LGKLELKKGDVVRLEGMLSLQVKRGKVLISGGLHRGGSKIIVPRAKSLPLEAETDAVVEYTLGEGGEIEKLSRRTIPQRWDTFIAEVLRKKPRLIVVIGDVDVGKTFFTTYVANTLLKYGIRVAAVDGDVGQSDIGPPSTIGLGIFERPVSLLYEVPVRTTHFVGSMSPSGHMLEFIVGMGKLVEIGLKEADMVIVNTPGWISEGPGRALQLSVMDLLNPDLVVALQRGRELEHLLKSMPREKIRRMPVYVKVRPRTRAERTFLRWLSLGRYFEGARKLALDLREVRLERCYLRTGEPLNPKTLGTRAHILYAEKLPEGLLVVTKDKLDQTTVRKLEVKFGRVKVITRGSEQNVLVGLVNDANELLGIGIIDEIDYVRGRMIVITPVKDKGKIAAVQFGSMKINSKGEEVGTIKPGSF
jgi:polynucleotide 5'-hydroxyl-kinase GRC3/NOL9